MIFWFSVTVAGGFPLPVIDKVDFTNSKLSLLQVRLFIKFLL